ncbi:hypothetical protein F3G60_01760 [Pseudomonas aeruginosa]|nr:hypothetical protein F3G60_01760 [Pseudomonas aeruginosa]
MRALAEFTMRGRMQATLAVAGSAVVPLLFWLSAAAGSLVLLRRGFGDAFGVLAWAVLPAMFWWYLGDPSILLVLLGTLTLAQILRASTSWSHVLLGSVAVGVVFALVLGHTSSELIGALATEVTKVLTQLRGESQLSGEELDKLQVALVPTLTGVMASSLQVTCLLCLMLARYWQASLYNPGGFGREFRSLRLAPAVAVILLLGAVVVPALEVQAAVFGPLCSVPLIIAGVALGHGLIALKRLAGGWLVGLYLAVLLLGNLICLLAVVDSLFDFRGRLARRQGSTNGEG